MCSRANEVDVLLDKEPWSKAAALMDLRWFVEVDTEVARVRLARRHVAAGIVSSLEEGDRRAVENDLPNGEEVTKMRVKGIDEVVKSVKDGGWVHL
jgi:pantothenate kinase